MIALRVLDCHPHDGDYLLLPTATYQLWAEWQVWAAALRLLWEAWCGAFALFVAGMAVMDGRREMSTVCRQVELRRAA